METKCNDNLLETIGYVFDKALGNKLEADFLESVKPALDNLSDYFGTTGFQSLLLATIFGLNCKGDTVNVKDLIEYYDCNPMRLMGHSSDLEWLHKNGYLVREKSRRRVNLTLMNYEFTLSETLSDAIISGKVRPTINGETLTDAVDVIGKIHQLMDQREENESSSQDLFQESEAKLKEYKHFPLIKFLLQLDLEIENKLTFIYLIWRSLMGKDTLSVSFISKTLFDKETMQVRYAQSCLKDENELLKMRLVELEPENFMEEARFIISDSASLSLNSLGLKTFVKKQNVENIIKAEDVFAKELIFTAKEEKQLTLLENSLTGNFFDTTREKLTQKGLPKGITALLHGYPGTGKTESVLQIARKTGRDIMKVDISQTKSKWFGDSERVIKRIFTDYKEYCKTCSAVPILLFNEADAIISKRKDVGTSAVAQTENAIQNIILEELENFDGIFFATTNLIANIDKAFDRRFLFKVDFRKPTMEAKSKIWAVKVPTLSSLECERLAETFDLSGGEIDNIVRKMSIQEVVQGKPVDFDTIFEFCQSENLRERESGKMGFKR